MNKKLVYVFGTIIILIIIIALIPGKKKKPKYDALSLTYEHASQTMPKIEPDATPEITEEATALVEATRPEGGYSLYLEGNFIVPTVVPSDTTGDLPDDSTGNLGNSTEDNTTDEKKEDNDSSTGNQSEETVDTADPADSFVPKSKDEVSDTGERAVPTEEIVLRSSPFYRETNIVVYVQTDVSLVVTDDYIGTKDPTIPFWVEVLYNDQVLYARGDVVTVGY